MFNRLKNYFSPVLAMANQPTDRLHECKPAELSSQPSDNTYVFVWGVTAKQVGHVAIQVGGDAPKTTDNQPGRYVSIHPGFIPSVGLLTVLPLPANLASTLNEDQETVFASRSASHMVDVELVLPSGFECARREPDQILEIKDLNTRAMHAKIDSVVEETESGRLAYQLFPQTNLLGWAANFFQAAPACLNLDPVDIALHQREEKNQQRAFQQPSVHNCATLVADILHAGGLQIEQSAMPWGLSPDQIGCQLAHLRRVA